MKHRDNALQMFKRLSIVFVLSVIFPTAGIGNDHTDRDRSVHFRNLHKDSSVKIIGHFGLPIGQALTLKGVRAKPSKLSNGSTLLVRTVNRAPFPEDNSQGWPPHIQIRNIHELPMSSTIIVEGYEFAEWRGSADKNWHIDVEFMVTRVVEPDTLKLDVAPP